MKLVRAELPENLLNRFEKVTKIFNIQKSSLIRMALDFTLQAFEKHIIEEKK
jgi:metal-responsive CopG/Arc/MetJ family transcriptional regulator